MLGDLKVSRYTAYHMWLSTRDMARLGLLMLHNGKWNGKQLVPADWVKESTSALTPYSQLNPVSERTGPWGYGYLWWVWDGPWNTGAFKGAYTSRGAFGQYFTVLPALGIAVAHKTVPVNQFFADTDYVQLLHRIAGDTPASEIVLPVMEKQGRARRFVELELSGGPHVELTLPEDVTAFAGCKRPLAFLICTGATVDVTPLSDLEATSGDLVIGPTVGVDSVAFNGLLGSTGRSAPRKRLAARPVLSAPRARGTDRGR